MGHSHLRVDLGVVRQGLQLAWDFGLPSLEEMTRVVELLEHSVYEPGSLRLDHTHTSFILRNPPLRTGAFTSVRLFWDGSLVTPGNVTVHTGTGAARSLGSLDLDHPLVLPVGRRTTFAFVGDPPDAGVHRIRLELQSVAIPPLVWFEFSDRLKVAGEP